MPAEKIPVKFQAVQRLRCGTAWAHVCRCCFLAGSELQPPAYAGHRAAQLQCSRLLSRRPEPVSMRSGLGTAGGTTWASVHQPACPQLQTCKHICATDEDTVLASHGPLLHLGALCSYRNLSSLDLHHPATVWGSISGPGLSYSAGMLLWGLLGFQGSSHAHPA